MNELAHKPGADGELRELALFAGGGGGILGGHLLGWRTVCAVECDPYAAGVLLARQNDGLLPPFPVWDDVRTFDGRAWRGRVDVVSGGFPCQDISAAGKGEGIDGARSGLWVEMARIVREVQPLYVFVENTSMLVSRGLGQVLGDLAAMGFDAAWGVQSACSVGAPHMRPRMFIVADSHGEHGSQGVWRRERREPQPALWWPGHGEHEEAYRGIRMDSGSGGAGVADGLAARVDRLRAIGNGQVPAVARLAWETLSAS